MPGGDASLFPTLLEPLAAAPREVGPYAAVAIEKGIDKSLDYAIPPRLAKVLRVGQRVRVPLGRNNRPTLGYVTAIREQSDFPKIKKLLAIDDERVLVPHKLMDLARWMSRYYCSPLGAVIESIIPSAVKKKIGVGYVQKVTLAQSREEIQAVLEKTKAPKRRAILARLLQIEPDHDGGAIDIVHLASEAGATVPTVRKLARMGLILITPEPDLPAWSLGQAAVPHDSSEADRTLNEDQQKVFDSLRPRIDAGEFSVNLLMGVTGSGKTEIYLQCIREVVRQGKGAIVLVPEIALTPQTVRRFTARFQDVAILHSGLTATERHRHWQTVSSGRAMVVVGARSAVFAPMPNLGIIVVDEEHEASYKQDQAPRYHGRDVAVKRGQLENVPVLLGSATPSLETYSKVAVATGHSAPGHYHLLNLPRRVRGLAMPHVELIDMKVENRFRRGVHLLSQRLEHLLRTTIDAGHQAILLLNRRGYSSFVYCASCSEPIHCEFCDATMTYHRIAGAKALDGSTDAGLHTGQLHCHYCLAVNPLPQTCPSCNKKLTLFGLGTQRVEEEIARKFPDLRFARVDSDSMRGSRDYELTLARFGRGEIQVMLGTQMIAKGLDYPNVTLVGVISGDTALALPDFRAAERTFQLITQVAGRAGRGDSPGRVVLQTFMPDDPTIQAAIKQDYVGFARKELAQRREVGLPPSARMARIVIRDQDADKLARVGDLLAADLTDAARVEGNAVQIKGPMPCAISRIAGYHRAQIVMTSASAAPLQRVLATARKKGSFAKNDRIAVDVDPVSLL